MAHDDGSVAFRAQANRRGPRLVSVGPTWPTPAGVAHNLPADLSSFVGRQREVEAIRNRLADARLLTLTGPGGIGKTRLAVRVARAAVAAFPDGVWLVELGVLTSPALVPRAVAAMLDVPEQPGRPISQSLVTALRGSRALLVLDNCEHLVDACATLSKELLRGCPELRVLATSREPLGVSGEVVWPVAPLTTPPAPRSPTSDGRESLSREVLRFDAVRLFNDRAAAVRPGFAVIDENAATIGQICRGLDGIPLAIELAAARVPSLTPEQIAGRLADRFSLLSRGSRTSSPRQRTLRASLDWSHDLLDDDERMLLRRLAVFAGGWTLEAAETICGEGVNVLGVLDRLVERSWIVAEERTSALVGRHVARRFRFLESMREYTAERLHEDPREVDLRRRHCDWYLALTEEAAREIWGAEQATWLARIEDELDNLRAALEFCAQVPEYGEVGLRIVGDLWRYWDLLGHLGEARGCLEKLLPLAVEPTPSRAFALQVAGYLAWLQGDGPAMHAYLEVGLALSRRLNDAHVTAMILHGLGVSAQLQGDLARARTLQEEGLELARQTESKEYTALALYQLAETRRAFGEVEGAAAMFTECLELLRVLGDLWDTSFPLFSLGHLALLRGDRATAKELLRESLAVRRGLRISWGIATSLEGLGWVAAEEGRPDRAARLLGASEALFERLGGALPPQWHDDHDRAVAAVREQLGEQALQSGLAAGRAILVVDAIEMAIDDVDLPTGASVAPNAAANLTPRELEVAWLVGRGLTNRQIADVLVISQLTAETHVRNILRKLDLETRSQVATWVVEHA